MLLWHLISHLTKKTQFVQLTSVDVHLDDVHAEFALEEKTFSFVDLLDGGVVAAQLLELVLRHVVLADDVEDVGSFVPLLGVDGSRQCRRHAARFDVVRHGQIRFVRTHQVVPPGLLQIRHLCRSKRYRIL